MAKIDQHFDNIFPRNESTDAFCKMQLMYLHFKHHSNFKLALLAEATKQHLMNKHLMTEIIHARIITMMCIIKIKLPQRIASEIRQLITARLVLLSETHIRVSIGRFPLLIALSFFHSLWHFVYSTNVELNRIFSSKTEPVKTDHLSLKMTRNSNNTRQLSDSLSILIIN
jgi:hypothetical protein